MKIIGHRGVPAIAPESTMESFRAARDRELEMVELDVRQTNDDKLAVIHDTAALPIQVETIDSVSYRTLAEVDFGNGQGVPLLDEVLSIFSSTTTEVNIELKDPIAKPVLHYLDRQDHVGKERLAISSFNHQILTAVVDRGYSVAPLIKCAPVSGQQLYEDLGDVRSVNLDVRFLTQQYVERIHRDDHLVYVYTVDTERKLHHVQHCGADGVFTNDPDHLQELVDQD